MSSSTQLKREQLSDYIQRNVIAEAAVKGIVVVGSVATGLAGPGSDIDAVVFLDPLDLYAIPAEFQWDPSTDSYHGIFVEVAQAVQFDFKRVDLQIWSAEGFEWPEPMRLELSQGWIAYDPNAQIADLVTHKTAYTNTVRQRRLDDAIVQLDQLLGETTIDEVWLRYDSATAHDRLNDAYEQLMGGVFAYNRVWRPWRSREQSYLVGLAWLPAGLRTEREQIVVPSSNDKAGYMQRAARLRQCAAALVGQCQADGLYGADPVGEAFLRTHDEPGRDWNIADWVTRHGA